MANIERRCNELKTKYPDKVSLFESYIQEQVAGYTMLENDLIGSVIVIR